MAENKLPDFESISDLVEFFDAHDMGEYEMPEAHFDVELKKRSLLVSVDKDLMKKLSQAARAQHVSMESLVNSWLEERVAKAA